MGAGPVRPLFDAIEHALGALPIVAEALGFSTSDVAVLRDGLGLPDMRILHFAFGTCAAASVVWAAIRAASASGANLAMFPLQDVLSLETASRMNALGTAVGNWT